MHRPARPDEVPAAGDADAEGTDIVASPADGATKPEGTDDEGWVEV